MGTSDYKVSGYCDVDWVGYVHTHPHTHVRSTQVFSINNSSIRYQHRDGFKQYPHV